MPSKDDQKLPMQDCDNLVYDDAAVEELVQRSSTTLIEVSTVERIWQPMFINIIQYQSPWGHNSCLVLPTALVLVSAQTRPQFMHWGVDTYSVENIDPRICRWVSSHIRLDRQSQCLLLRIPPFGTP